MKRELQSRAEELTSLQCMQEPIKSVFAQSEIRHVSLISSRRRNTNYRLRLINPNIEVCLRIYGEEDAGERALNELNAYELVRKNTQIPIPEIYGMDISKRIVNNVFAVQEYIHGNDFEAVAPSIQVTDRKFLAHQIGDYLAQLHSLNFDRFGTLTSQNTTLANYSWRDFFLELAADNIRWCEENEAIDSNMAGLLARYFANLASKIPNDVQPSLLHNDFHQGNFRVKFDREGKPSVCGIFDFEDSIGGHNEYDFVKPFWFIFYDYPEMENYAIQSYSSIKDLPDGFRERIIKIYSIGEILSFLKYGTIHKMTREVKSSLTQAMNIIGSGQGALNYYA